MNPSEHSQLTRSELLLVDELGDQLEREWKDNPEFDPAEFFSSIKSPLIVSVLKSELERLSKAAQAQTVPQHSSPCPVAEQVRRFKPGQVIDDFELVRLVGRGATAVVWQARNLKLNRSVALKFPTVFSTSMASRLTRESQAVARLQHPNIATIFEIRNFGKSAYLVSELVDGESLQSLIDKDEQTIDESIDLLISIVEAIAYSHSMKVVHRDIKPQNILIREDGSPVVVDFGLARVLHGELTILTHEGDFVGTPGYMAPEQALGRTDIDERSDIYALGVLMFQLLSKQLPFVGSVQSVIYQVINEPAPDLNQIESVIPKDLATICQRCLEKSPNQRFQSATELALELRRFRNGEPLLSRPISSVEKVTRWAKNKPVEATLASMLSISVVILLIGALVYGAKMRSMRNQEHALRVKAENSELEARRLTEEIKKALAESEIQKQFARNQASENKSSVDFLKSVFHDSNPVMWILKGEGLGVGKPPTLRQLFVNAAERIDREYDGNQKTKANLLETLADSGRSAGFLDLSRQLLEKAKSLRERFAHADPDLQVLQDELVYNQFLFARLEHDCGNYDEADELYNECVSKLRATDSEQRSNLRIEAESCFHLARLHLTLHRNQIAKEYFRTACTAFDRAGDSESFLRKACQIGIEFCDIEDGKVPSSDVLVEYFRHDSWAKRVIEELAKVITHKAISNFQGAIDSYDRLFVILLERLPENNRWYLLALGDYAGLQKRAGHYEAALSAAEKAIKGGEEIAPNHPVLLNAKIELGKELSRGGRYEHAYRQLQDVDQKLNDKNGDTSNVDLNFELITCAIRLGKYDDAIEYSERLTPLVGSWYAVQTAWLRYLESQAWIERDPNFADEAFGQAVGTAKLLTKPPENGIWCHRMGEIFIANESYEKAVEFLRAGVKWDSKNFFPEHPRVANRRMLLGKALLLNGNSADALTEFQLAYDIRSKFLSPQNELVQESKEAVQALSNTAALEVR